MKDANERIKEAFPDMVPSGGYDYVDEVMGLLRVTRSQRDDMERLWVETSKKLEALQTNIESDLDYDRVKLHIENLPATWYPALLIALVQAAYSKNVFQHGGASQMVGSLERRGLNPVAPESDLRTKMQAEVDLVYEKFEAWLNDHATWEADLDGLSGKDLATAAAWKLKLMLQEERAVKPELPVVPGIVKDGGFRGSKAGG